MDGLGLGYEALAARNPSIVYGTVQNRLRSMRAPVPAPTSSGPAWTLPGRLPADCMEATGDLVPFAIRRQLSWNPDGLQGCSLRFTAPRRTGQGEFLDVAMYDSVHDADEGSNIPTSTA